MGSKPSQADESSTDSKDAKPASPGKGCCGCSAAPAEEWGMIPTQQRKCRDSLCCLLFLIFWAGMIVVGAFGIYFGNPARLLYGTDYLGQTCGSSAAVKDSKYIVYPRVNEDFLANVSQAYPQKKHTYLLILTSTSFLIVLQIKSFRLHLLWYMPIFMPCCARSHM
jgi:hypothetical protein